MRFHPDGMRTRPLACWADWIALALFIVLGLLLLSLTAGSNGP
jgi:hypothetical protein